MCKLKDYKIEGIVEATTFELICIQLQYSKDERYKIPSMWTFASAITVGEFNKFPVVISIEVYLINGKHILFWNSTSRVVDYNIIDNFFRKNYPGVRLTNAMNFRNVL